MNYKAGELIKYLRKEKKMSQEKLSEGIMSRVHLSRIEKDENTPTMDVVIFLLERLEVSPERLFPYSLDENDFKLFALRDKLEHCLAASDYGKAAELLAMIEKAFGPHPNNIRKQYILMNKAILVRRLEKDSKKALKLLEEAIGITVKDYNEKHIRSYLLASQEITILNNIAAIHCEHGEVDRAVCMLERMAEKIRRYSIDERQKARMLTYVLLSLSNALGAQKRYDEANNICDEAIDAGRENRVSELLPNLMYNKAYALHCLGHPEDEVKHLLYQAYYGSIEKGRVINAAQIRDKALHNFGIEVDKTKD